MSWTVGSTEKDNTAGKLALLDGDGGSCYSLYVKETQNVTAHGR